MKRKDCIKYIIRAVALRLRCLKIPQSCQGDIYLEFLVCMVLFIMLLSVSLQIISAIQLKFWLDRRTATIVRHVQICGEIDGTAEEMVSEIEGRLGGDPVIEWEARFISGTRKIQLGDRVRLHVIGEKALLSFGKKEIIKISLESEMVGTCERYWKG